MNINFLYSQIIGAEIVYQCKANGIYEITLVNYYSCGNQPIKEFQYVTVFESLAKGSRTDIKLHLINKAEISNNAPSNCDDISSCIQKATYKAEANLHSVIDGYDIVWKNCCFGNLFENIESLPEDGFSIVSHIPEARNNEFNSSPVFLGNPMANACSGSEGHSLQNAADTIDGDSVVVVFSKAKSSTPSFPSNTGMKGPEGSSFIDLLPYNDFKYKSDYTYTSQFNSAKSDLKPATGEFLFDSLKSGFYLFTISAIEFRNGKELSETQRVIKVQIK